MASLITISGVSIPLQAIEFPSGLFSPGAPGANLCAFLTSINATFGFNVNPHNFQTEWVPCQTYEMFHGASGQLPDVGSPLEFYVGDFLVKGLVSHADWTSSEQGTIVKITIEDERRKLRRIKIHTEDLGENVPSGIVSVARAYRKLNGLVDIDGDPLNSTIREYNRILEFGCSYPQILQAIDLTFNEGKCDLPATEFPTALQIEQNIDGTLDAIRFQFNLDTMDEAVTRIMSDTGYEWYWNMDAERINIINRRVPFELSETQILSLISQFGSLSGLDQITQLGFGQDAVPDPTRFRVLGGHQEGIINSELLSPIDGLDTSELDHNIVFSAAWNNIAIGFYDADGFYRTYIPSEKELQLALAGIEQWSYFKKYQTLPSTNNPPGYNLPPDDGSIAAQHPSFQSRLDQNMPLAGLATGAAESGLRIISNRRDEENNWTLSFYNRVQNHASRHYGKSYVAEGILYNQNSGLFRLIDSAWANVENQIQGYTLSASGTVASSGTLFVDDYEINRRLGPISPFVTNDFRVSAHVVLEANTVYGPRGEDSPAGFGNWTEDAQPFNPSGDGKHYIPCNLTLVGQRVINPRNEQDLYGFEAYPEGTIWCQLPINAGPASGLVNDAIIHNLATLVNTNTKLTGSGLLDLINPATILNCYTTLSGVAIPVESRLRYGQKYPSEWYLGDYHYERHEDVQLDDQFVPWAFSPQGNKNSLQIMTDRAVRRILGKIVPKNYSRYADFNQVGLPLLSFDSFADQNLGPSGRYGQISHGVNEVNIGFSFDGFSTRYKIQSYFPQFGREAPQGERVRALLNGIINPIDFTNLKLTNNSPVDARNTGLPGDPQIPVTFFDTEQRASRVTITEVNNVFTLSNNVTGQERYRGIDQNHYIKPHIGLDSSNPDFTLGAICIDGFLNVGDQAIYHTDQFEIPGGNIVNRYFSQGRPFSNGTVVQVQQQNAIDPTKYDVTIVDGTSAQTRAIKGVQVLNGTVSIGDRTNLSAAGNATIVPGSATDNIYINGTVTAGAGVSPVQIISVSNQGSVSARAICRLLDNNGNLSASGTLYTGVVPIPFPQFAASGDKGFLATASVPSGILGISTSVSFIEIVKPGFFRYQ